jgi:hypothetical protein
MISGPIVLIGPGSEWFWSMAQFVVVAITLLGIYFQLRLQRATNAFDHLTRLSEEFQGEFSNRTKVLAARALVAGQPVPGSAMTVIGNYWDRIAVLVRHGHLDIGVVHDAIGTACRFWWALLEADIRRMRSGSEASDAWVDFEWLAGELARIADLKGSVMALDRATLIATLPDDIRAWEERIRMLEDSRRA